MKKNRKAKQFYSLLNSKGAQVNIDLNNYKVTCTKTGNSKSFYHKYLHNLIVRKHAGNIDRFRTEYVSREAAPDRNERRAAQIISRIQKLSVQLSNLKGELADVERGVVSFPDA